MIKLIRNSYDWCGNSSSNGYGFIATVLAIFGFSASLFTILAAFVALDVSWVGFRVFVSGLIVMIAPVVVYYLNGKGE